MKNKDSKFSGIFLGKIILLKKTGWTLHTILGGRCLFRHRRVEIRPKNIFLPDGSFHLWYYGLPVDATVRDVVLRVRADEHMHRDFNHMLGDKHARGDDKSPPHFMGVSNVDNLEIRM